MAAPASAGAYASQRSASIPASRSSVSRSIAFATWAAKSGDVAAASRVFTWPDRGYLAKTPRMFVIVVHHLTHGPPSVGLLGFYANVAYNLGESLGVPTAPP